MTLLCLKDPQWQLQVLTCSLKLAANMHRLPHNLPTQFDTPNLQKLWSLKLILSIQTVPRVRYTLLVFTTLVRWKMHHSWRRLFTLEKNYYFQTLLTKKDIVYMYIYIYICVYIYTYIHDHYLATSILIFHAKSPRSFRRWYCKVPIFGHPITGTCQSCFISSAASWVVKTPRFYIYIYVCIYYIYTYTWASWEPSFQLPDPVTS